MEIVDTAGRYADPGEAGAGYVEHLRRSDLSMGTYCLRAGAVALGLIPPRTMHSPQDAQVLLGAARGARRVVEIGVY